MSGIAQLRDRILERPAVPHALARAGIDPLKYRLLMDLFDALAERYEIMGATNTIGLGMMFGFSVFMSFIPCLFILAHPSLPVYILVPLGLTMYQLFAVVTGDAANSLLNPEKASVLAHFPISGLTYVAVKASHLLLIFPAIRVWGCRDASLFVVLRSNFVFFWHDLGGRPNNRAARVSKRIFEFFSPEAQIPDRLRSMESSPARLPNIRLLTRAALFRLWPVAGYSTGKLWPFFRHRRSGVSRLSILSSKLGARYRRALPHRARTNASVMSSSGFAPFVKRATSSKTRARISAAD